MGHCICPFRAANLEDKARSTRDNFRNIAKMEGFSKDTPVVMISSDYHMDRAVRIAEKAGFTHVMRLPAPSGFSLTGPTCSRRLC